MTSPTVAIVSCTVTDCDWSCSGVRDMPDTVRAMRLGEFMGVSATFFINQWMTQEFQRIEDEIADHMNSHTLREFLATIAILRTEVHNLTDENQTLRQRTCDKICCNR